tara:strand:+ start:168 stop:491 length:324 start_codon:yes stop_codon:yes gene_type:complete
MDAEKIILFQIYLNSYYGNNEFSLSEFSEKFISEEIKNSLPSSISKLQFANAVEKLEKNEMLKKSSRHHLTTLNSWRLTEKSKHLFQILSENKITDFENFKSEINLR